MGAGRTEIMRALFGIDRLDSGDLDFRPKTGIRGPYDAIRKGLGLITENRKDEGLLLDTSIRENISLPNLTSFSPKGIIDRKREAEFVELLIKRLTIKTASPETAARHLSGGNQQKSSSPNGSESARKFSSLMNRQEAST